MRDDAAPAKMQTGGGFSESIYTDIRHDQIVHTEFQSRSSASQLLEERDSILPKRIDSKKCSGSELLQSITKITISLWKYIQFEFE